MYCTHCTHCTPPPLLIPLVQMLPGKYPRALALTADGNSHLVDIKEVRMVVVVSCVIDSLHEFVTFLV